VAVVGTERDVIYIAYTGAVAEGMYKSAAFCINQFNAVIAVQYCIHSEIAAFYP